MHFNMHFKTHFINAFLKCIFKFYLLKFSLNEFVFVKFLYRKKTISLKCQVVSEELFESIPKILDFLPANLNEEETRRSNRRSKVKN
jgi:hypothetical protein